MQKGKVLDYWVRCEASRLKIGQEWLLLRGEEGKQRDSTKCGTTFPYTMSCRMMREPEEGRQKLQDGLNDNG